MPRFAVLVIAALVVGACTAVAPGSPAPSTTEMPAMTRTARPTATPSAAPSSTSALPAFEPDEPLVVYAHVTGAGGGIFVMRPDGSGRTQLATDVLPGVHKRPDWSPDGQQVVFVDETTERLYVANLDGRPTTLLPTCADHGCDYARWSPDGTRIAYSRYENAAGVDGPASVGIEVIELATGRVTEVARLERPLLADVPTWSPDGTQIAFEVDRMDDATFETGAALAVVPVTGGELRYLTDFDLFAGSPDWGWVADEIAFSTELIDLRKEGPLAGETRDLWVVRPDGSAPPRRLTHVAPGGKVRAPRWSPDGTAITAADEVSREGIIVDVATGDIRSFLTSGIETRPAIRPLPSS